MLHIIIAMVIVLLVFVVVLANGYLTIGDDIEDNHRSRRRLLDQRRDLLRGRKP